MAEFFWRPFCIIFDGPPVKRSLRFVVFFILINSLSGLAGQILKTGAASAVSGISATMPLLLAVVIGGVIGGRFVIEGVANQRVAQLTGLLVLVVGLRILWSWVSYSSV